MKKWSIALSLLLAASFCGAAEFELVKATYGAGDQSRDVTDTMKGKLFALPGGVVAIQVDNATFAPDPARGKQKKLDVVYKLDGAEKTDSVAEGNAFILFPGAEAAKEFKFIGAFYGAKDKWNNVGEKVGQALENNLDLTVNNLSMGGDPISGIQKTLVIFFTSGDKLKMVAFPETRKVVPAELKKR